jgi:peptidylprolyl isomerase domain and WD repeat-containing protein 1
VSDSKE